MSGAIDLEKSSGEWTDFFGDAWDFVQEGALTYLDFEKQKSGLEREYVPEERQIVTTASTDTAKPNTGLYIGLGVGAVVLLMVFFLLARK